MVYPCLGVHVNSYVPLAVHNLSRICGSLLLGEANGETRYVTAMLIRNNQHRKYRQRGAAFASMYPRYIYMRTYICLMTFVPQLLLGSKGRYLFLCKLRWEFLPCEIRSGSIISQRPAGTDEKPIFDHQGERKNMITNVSKGCRHEYVNENYVNFIYDSPEQHMPRFKLTTCEVFQ